MRYSRYLIIRLIFIFLGLLTYCSDLYSATIKVTPTILVYPSSTTTTAWDSYITLTIEILGSSQCPTGTVTVSGVQMDGTPTTTNATDSGCSANTTTWTQNWSPGPSGSYPITVTYSGDSFYNSVQDNSVTIAVDKSSSPGNLYLSKTNATVGESISISADLTSMIMVTGSISFNSNGSALAGCTNITIQSYGAIEPTCTINFLSPGTYSIMGSYSGDTNHYSSTTNAVSLDVTKANSAVTVAATPNPVAIGANTVITATVSGYSPTGTVSFTLPGPTAIAGCSNVALTGGGNSPTASCTTSFASAGARTVTASYGGDSNNLAGSGNATVTVSQTTTSLALATSLNPSQPGQSVVVTATISPSGSTGTVAFTRDGSPLAGCSAVSVWGDQAQCSVVFGSSGSFTIQASYSGDANHQAASVSLVQVVSTYPLVLSSSSSTVAAGDSLVLTAHLASGSYSGTFSFYLPSGVPISGCYQLPLIAVNGGGYTATCTTVFTQSGQKLLQLYYQDAQQHLQVSLPITVLAVTTTPDLALVSGPNPSTPGEKVVLTATLLPTTSTGKMQFWQDGNPIAACQEVPITNGVASCSIVNLGSGSFIFRADYVGNYSSVSATMVHTVVVLQESPLQVSATLLPNRAGTQFSVTIPSLANVSATGTVSIVVAEQSCQATLQAGKAQCTLGELYGGSVGTVRYSGDNHRRSQTRLFRVAQVIGFPASGWWYKPTDSDQGFFIDTLGSRLSLITKRGFKYEVQLF